MFSTRSRRATAGILGLTLLAGLAPALAESAQAATLRHARATVSVKVGYTAHRTASVTMRATAVATIPGSTIKPIRVSATASARRAATVHATGRATATRGARATTTRAAQAKARMWAHTVAARTARGRASARAARLAQASARRSAMAQARAAAVQLAKKRAAQQAAALAPGVRPSTGVVSVDPAGRACGGVLPQRVGGGKFTSCSFDDEFSGSTLDTTKWTATDSVRDKISVGDECYDPSNVSVNADSLKLTGTKSAARYCVDRMRSYNAGQISTLNKFSQTYGRFEMRAKFPAGAGYATGFWMLPQNPMANGYSGYKYGEIDIVENWGLYPSLAWAHLHYAYTPGNLMGGTYCSMPTDGGFHTYAVDWSASRMTFIYDNKPCWTTTWQPFYPYAPAGAAAPAPFDQPFYIILNLTLGGSASTPSQPLSSTPMGKSAVVDWVRAWK